MQNGGNAKYTYSQEGYTNRKLHLYVKCALCHKDFKTEKESSRVCDRCWKDYEAHPVSLDIKPKVH